ncbi:hypothetical protein ACU60T_23505 [Klebsiella aerogenes]
MEPFPSHVPCEDQINTDGLWRAMLWSSLVCAVFFWAPLITLIVQLRG